MRKMVGITFMLCIFLLDVYNANAQDTSRPICTDLDRQCSIRAQENSADIPTDRSDLYMCSLLQTGVNCTEEYICTCGLQVTQAMINGHDAGYDEYTRTCQNVPEHNFRTGGGLSCRSDLVISLNNDPNIEASLVETENTVSVQSAVVELDKKCPGYADCHKTYVERQNLTLSSDWPNSRKFEFLCDASLESIACTEKVMCGCGQGDNVGLKQAFRQIRHQHETQCNEDISVGYLRCDDSSDTEVPTPATPPEDLARLCQYPVTACEERQQKKMADFSQEELNTRNAYVICELTKINTKCIEDLLCECPGMQQADLVQQFNDVRLSYISNCSGVVGHELRAEEIRCRDSIKDLTKDNPDEEIELGEVEGGLDLGIQAKEIDNACPGYEHCYNITTSYNDRAASQSSERDRMILVCEGSRLNILCLDDVLCSCGWSTADESRRTVRQLRHNHEQFCDEDLTIGYLNCDGNKGGVEKPGQLCENFIDTCERRVIARYALLHDQKNYTYISCETFKVRIQCFEDYICSCPGQQTTVLQDNFNTYKIPYEETCQDVPPHRIRTGDLYCKDQIKSGPGNAGLELGTEEEAVELSLLDQARLLDKQCPGYELCFNVTAQYNKLVSQETTLARQLALSCQGSKYVIICLEDALCGCGWGNNTNFGALLRQMRHQHEVTCNEDLTIGYLECGATSMQSISWFLTMCLAAIFVDMFLVT